MHANIFKTLVKSRDWQLKSEFYFFPWYEQGKPRSSVSVCVCVFVFFSTCFLKDTIFNRSYPTSHAQNHMMKLQQSNRNYSYIFDPRGMIIRHVSC